MPVESTLLITAQLCGAQLMVEVAQELPHPLQAPSNALYTILLAGGGRAETSQNQMAERTIYLYESCPFPAVGRRRRAYHEVLCCGFQSGTVHFFGDRDSKRHWVSSPNFKSSRAALDRQTRGWDLPADLKMKVETALLQALQGHAERCG